MLTAPELGSAPGAADSRRLGPLKNPAKSSRKTQARLAAELARWSCRHLDDPRVRLTSSGRPGGASAKDGDNG